MAFQFSLIFIFYSFYELFTSFVAYYYFIVCIFLYIFLSSISILFKYFQRYFREIKSMDCTTREQQRVRDEMSTSVALVLSYASKQEPFMRCKRSEDVRFWSVCILAHLFYYQLHFLILSLYFFHFF